MRSLRNLHRIRRFPTALLWTALLAFLLPAVSSAEIVFGPETFTRSPGAPETFIATFERCGTGACRLIVVNGNPDGTDRVSSARILLNGVEVVGPADFNPQTGMIVKTIFPAAENELMVRLASKPGSFVTITVDCVSPGILSLGPAGVSVPTPTLLFLAVPIINNGAAAVQNVEVTSISLTGGTLTSPVLPVSLGTIPAGGSAILNATFSGVFLPGDSPVLTVEGTFSLAGSIFCFSLSRTLVIPPAAPGSALLGSVMVMGHEVTEGNFPPQPPRFDERVNPAGWTVPMGPFVPGVPTATQTMRMAAPLSSQSGIARAYDKQPAITLAPDAPLAIVFEANEGFGITDASTTAEPSGGATAGGVIFATANWLAAYSDNGGSSFTELDPTTIFPNDAVGYCCDQIVQYVPSINRFVWFLQGNGYRLAVASPQQILNNGGTAWTYWNLVPTIFGQPAGTGFDYPDLAVGDNQLYMSWDAGSPCTAGCNQGFQVARTSLAGLAAGGTITIEFTNPANGTMAWGSHLSQDTGDEIFWAGHNNSSNMRIFSLQEGSNTYFWRDRNVSSWPTNAPTSLTPDNRDWLAKNFNGPNGNSFPRNGVIGAARQGNQIWFGWTAGTNTRFPQAHIQIAVFDRGDSYNKSAQHQVWNPDYAFAYPAFSRNVCTSEIGMSFEFGGGGNYENHVVGFWGDFIAWITTASNVGTTRFGDYVTIRQAPFTDANPGNLFTAFGYGLNLVSGSSRSDIHYVLFGRPSSSCVIIK
jgi:hypothetical protein